MHFIEKDDKKHINGRLLAQSLITATDTTNIHHFGAFTLSEMQAIDQKIGQLTVQIEVLYRSKYIKKCEA